MLKTKTKAFKARGDVIHITCACANDSHGAFSKPFSDPEAALLLFSTKNRDLWHRKSAIRRLPVTLRMLRVKSDKSDWFWSQSIMFTKQPRPQSSQRVLT